MGLNAIYIPTFISSIDYVPVRVLPHVYFYNGTKDTNTFFVEGFTDGTRNVVSSTPLNVFPYFDNVSGNTPTETSLSLLFNPEQPAFGVTPTGSLYTEYWETYITLLYNPRTRLINASAIIPLADYFKMELNDIVQWRGNFYHLRAINEYNLKTGVCNIQLLGPVIPDTFTKDIDCSFNFDVEDFIPPTTLTPTVTPTATPTTTVTPTITPTDTPTTTLTPTTTTLTPTTTEAPCRCYTVENPTEETLDVTYTPCNQAETTIAVGGGLTVSLCVEPGTIIFREPGLNFPIECNETCSDIITCTVCTTGTTTLTPTATPTTTTTTPSLSRNFKFDISSSLNNPYSVDTKMYVYITGSGTAMTGSQTIAANSNTSFSTSFNMTSSIAPFIFEVGFKSGSNSIGVTQGGSNYYDVVIVDTYDNGLAPISSSYLGNGGISTQPVFWNGGGFWSASLWNSVTRSVEIKPSVDRDLLLYNMSGSNGFASYTLAKPYLTSSGSIAATIGILLESQSLMENGFARVPAYNTDYSTRYQVNIPANRFYIAEFNNNRQIVRLDADTYNSSSNAWVHRLDSKITLPINQKSTNNINGTNIPSSPCSGAGTSTSDLYYNQQSGSFYPKQQAYAYYNFTWANQNTTGAPAYKNSSLTTAFSSGDFGAFQKVTGLEQWQGNYTAESDGKPFMVYYFESSPLPSGPVSVVAEYTCP